MDYLLTDDHRFYYVRKASDFSEVSYRNIEQIVRLKFVLRRLDENLFLVMNGPLKGRKIFSHASFKAIPLKSISQGEALLLHL